MAKDKDKKETKVSGVSEALKNLSGFIQKGARTGDVEKIPTGYFNLDFAINYGTLPEDFEIYGSKHKTYDPKKPVGIPCGRLVHLYGAEGSGKSYLCYRMAGFAQRMGHKVAWIDTEQSFSEDLAVINGVDIDELLYSDLHNSEDPDKIFYAEDVMDGIVNLVKSGVKLVILDSVANLVPKARMEADAEQQYVALLARLLSENLGRIVQWAGAKDAVVVFINQLREKPNMMFGGNPMTTKGGRMLSHNSSLSIEVSKCPKSSDPWIFIEDDRVPGGKRLIGRKSKIRFDKNRFSKPFVDQKGNPMSVDIPIYYEPYFPNIEETLLETGRQQQIIKLRVGTYKWTDAVSGKEYKAEDKDEFINMLKGDVEMRKALLAELKKNAKENGNPLSPEIIQYDPEIVVKRVEATEEDMEEAEKISEKKGKKKSKIDFDESVENNEEALEV